MISKELFFSLLRSQLKVSQSKKWHIYFSKNKNIELTVGEFSAEFSADKEYIYQIENWSDNSILLSNWFEQKMLIEDFLNQVFVLSELNSKEMLRTALLMQKSRKKSIIF